MGKRIAKKLGHTLIESVPSLFTFKLLDQWLTICSGMSINNLHLKLITLHIYYNHTNHLFQTFIVIFDDSKISPTITW